MKFLFRVLIGLCALAALPPAAFFAAGPERILERIAGPADQGAVDVATLTRRPTPTDSLACTPGFCAAGADIELPVYAEPPEALMIRLDAVVLADPRHLTRVDDGRRPAYRRYVARTPIMRYADTIDAIAAPSGTGASLALYGRSQLGTGDWGVNRARIEGWIAGLGEPKAVPVSAAGTPVS